MNGHSYIENLEEIEGQKLRMSWGDVASKKVSLTIHSVRPTIPIFSIPIGIEPELVTEYRRMIKKPKNFTLKTFKFLREN